MKRETRPGVLLLTFPYASETPVIHAHKLVEMLRPNCQQLYVVGDCRLKLPRTAGNVHRLGDFPTLHNARDVTPAAWSVLLWLGKLGWILIRAAWELWQVRHRVSVIVCFLEVFFLPVLCLGRILGKKIIYFEPSGAITAERTFPHRYSWGRLWVSVRAGMRGFVRKIADRLVVEALCEMQAGELEPYRDKLRALPQYVDGDQFSVDKPVEKRPRCVGFIGRLVEIKGIETFLAAISQIPVGEAFFLIVGEGYLRPVVEEALRTPEMAHTQIRGWLEGEALVETLNGLCLLVMPSSGEGIPNILLEAMACGTPVLATAVGGIPEVVEHGVTGFLLPDRSPESLRKGIQRALNSWDLAGVAQRARRLVEERFSLTAAVQRWGKLLAEVTR